ncbi:MAG: ferritin family protein [Desulfatiglans sp.]|jgi:rubrerythrin|nr:ferritin family protein [Thermodesulfobacteriota bacterium]MEE4354333.1 ferritin family protein [Desulfatiglans sp.]
MTIDFHMLFEKMISRRQLLYSFSLLSFLYPILRIDSFVVAENMRKDIEYPLTIDILKEAYWAEMTAKNHYDGYCQKALAQNYPNIAYLFRVLSSSERIHAENYQKLIKDLGSTIKKKRIPVSVADTKANLNTAAVKEMEKIEHFYPKILKDLSPESNDRAIIHCMYSWKSHKQHEEIIKNIKKYSGLFFKPLAKRIERMNPNYHVCEICGSTVDEEPETPCDICNYPRSHYKKLERPILLTN